MGARFGFGEPTDPRFPVSPGANITIGHPRFGFRTGGPLVVRRAGTCENTTSSGYQGRSVPQGAKTSAELVSLVIRESDGEEFGHALVGQVLRMPPPLP